MTAHLQLLQITKNNKNDTLPLTHIISAFICLLSVFSSGLVVHFQYHHHNSPCCLETSVNHPKCSINRPNFTIINLYDLRVYQMETITINPICAVQDYVQVRGSRRTKVTSGKDERFRLFQNAEPFEWNGYRGK